MKRMSARAVVLVVALAAGSVLGAAAPTRLTTEMQPLTLRQMALFKNGLGFFVGEVALPAGQTALRFALPAVPSQGTFWLSYPAQVRPQNIVARRTEAAGKMLEAISIPEILKANIGREVRLIVDAKVISGRITGFTQDRRPIRPLPYAAGTPQRDAERAIIWPTYYYNATSAPSDTGLCFPT
ncbi:MAG: hypothetical protein FJ280_27445 [Planctomycetes bacterium]|nr:hypothetical protein [Planctomycetota bacterium]